MTGRVLLVEDDTILREFIAHGLQEIGCVVTAVGTVASLNDLASSQCFDAWVVDRRVSDGDCLDALRVLRRGGNSTPALVLTSLGGVDQRVDGLNAGADDYLEKPFSISELAARVKALLRRPKAFEAETVTLGALTVHLATASVTYHGRDLGLTASEFRLLRLLSASPGSVLSRAHIRTSIGMSPGAKDVAVDHLVSRLRQKLEETGTQADIRTVRGQGFCWPAIVASAA